MDSNRSAQADALLGELQRQGGGRLTLFWARRPALARPTRCCRGRASWRNRAWTWWSAWSKPTAARRRRRCSKGSRCCRASAASTCLQTAPAACGGTRPRCAARAQACTRAGRELAHRNMPGSRHERRWQDVVELLDAGIDVYTTINIRTGKSQDVIHRITGVRVSETVPDLVFDAPARHQADRPATARTDRAPAAGQGVRAKQAALRCNVLLAFQPGRAARVAMQTAADHVDGDLREDRGTRTARGILAQARTGRDRWPRPVRLPGTGGATVAERRNAPWSVVSVQSGAPLTKTRNANSTAPSRWRAGSVASRTAAWIQHRRRADRPRRRSGVSTIVIGRPANARLRECSTAPHQQLLQRAAHLELTIVSTPEARAKSRRSCTTSGLLTPPMRDWRSPRPRWPPHRVAGRAFHQPRRPVDGVHRRGGGGRFADTDGRCGAGRRPVLPVLQLLLHRAALHILHRRTARGGDRVLFLAAAWWRAGWPRACACSGRPARRQRARHCPAGIEPAVGGGGRCRRGRSGGPACAEAGDRRGRNRAGGRRRAGDGRPAGVVEQGPRGCGLGAQASATGGRFTDTWAMPNGGSCPSPATRARPAGRLALPRQRQPLRQRTTPAGRGDGGRYRAGDVAHATGVGSGGRARHRRDRTPAFRAVVIVSHDLRSPLAAIVGAAETLDTYGHDMARTIATACSTPCAWRASAGCYIQNLLDMTRSATAASPQSRLDWRGRTDRFCSDAFAALPAGCALRHPTGDGPGAAMGDPRWSSRRSST